MNIGVIFRYYKKSRFGFIKTYNESIFFHFSELKNFSTRKDVVIFDIEETEKGIVAKNIRSVNKISGLAEKLFNESLDEKTKWILLEDNAELYNKERKHYLERENIKKEIQTKKKEADIEFDSKLNNFNKYINQFKTDKFWNDFKIEIGAKWSTSGGRDWTEAWWDYGIESKYNIEKIDSFTTIKDSYILKIISFWKFIVRVDWHTAKNENVYKRKELKFDKEYFENLKNEIKNKFDKEYSKDEHFQSLRKYYPKMDIIKKKYTTVSFDSLIANYFNEYLTNNLKNNETIELTRREIDEDLEMNYG